VQCAATESIPLLETHMAVNAPLQSCKCLSLDFFVWMNTIVVLACSFNNSQLRVCTLRQMLGGTCVPAQKSLHCRRPQRCIPSFHFASFHLLALLACIHMHLFTEIFLLFVVACPA
jgi:hypothetical protein